MQIDIRSETLDQYITILKGDYVSIDIRRKFSKLIRYALHHDLLENKKRAEKLIRILMRPASSTVKFDLVHKAKCIMFIQEIKTHTKELSNIQTKEREEINHEINIMEDYLRECGCVTIFEPYREPHRRIITVNNIKSFKERFLQNTKDTLLIPGENKILYYFEIPSSPSRYSLDIEIREQNPS